MPLQEYASDAVHRHISELTARIIAQSGIPLDRLHLGKILLQSFKDAPDFVLHIDGATGKYDTFESGLRKSVQCATAFRKMGLKKGDVVIVMAPNHIDLPIPFYSGLYIGAAVSGIDMTLKVDELAEVYKNILPKIVFCQNEKANDVQQALNNIKHEALIVTFDESDHFMTFSDLLECGKDVSVEDFKASDFDPKTTLGLLVPTSGTSGIPKAAATTHANWITGFPYVWSIWNSFPTPLKMHFTVSPVQWLSATALFIFSPILRFTRLQSSSPINNEHFYELVNKYKPSVTLASPNFYMQILTPGVLNKCDLTCFECIMVGGSAVPASLVADMKKLCPKTKVCVLYGLSEMTGITHDFSNSVHNSVGGPMPFLQYRLVNKDTQEDINEPNVPGELWMKGPTVFLGYYNNREMTEDVLTKDGWFKSGDILYRDESWNFFFVERLKFLMKYLNHQISPVEIETVIMRHPGVLDVAVTGIPDTRGDLPVACVVRHEGSDLTAEEIKNMVKESLADTKQLRGGVIFMKELPMTPSFKVNRSKLAKMVLEMERL